jgi:N-acetylglucosaminyldiphosphoundecaprenol N-acetyl-beta-D-mannosaminyltransferase
MASARSIWPDRVNILGVGIAAANIPLALEHFDGLIAEGARQYICVADVHLVMQAQWDPALRLVLNQAGMITSDGMPLVWLCRRARGPHAGRVYGPDLLMAACEHGLKAERRHYFLGGAPGVADELARRLMERFPGLKIAGAYSPPFGDAPDAQNEAEVARRINAAKPDFLWVGLGAPKQEFWMRRFRPLLDVPVMLGVGAAFDFHSGTKPQAPKFLRSAGLEWVFRLATEPARLWPRYRKVVPGFVYRVALQSLGLARYTLD